MKSSILNRDAAGGFQHPADGWYQIEAKGFHPAIAGDGTKVVQVIDDQCIQSCVNRFNADSDARKFRHGGEMIVDREHLRHTPNGDSSALAWTNRLRTTPDGNGIDSTQRWTSEGKPLVDGGVLRFFSTEYEGAMEEVPAAKIPVEIQNKFKGYTFVRPLELTGLSLTNQNNNRGQKGITNRSGAELANKTFTGSREPADKQQQQNKGQKMKSVCTLLGLSAEADEQSVHAAIATLKNRITTLEPLDAANLTLKNRVTALEGEQCEALMDAAGLDADKDKTKRERLKPVLCGMKNREERTDFLKDIVRVEKPLAGRAQHQLHNRDSKVPSAQSGGENEAQDKAFKIQNRATELQGKGIRFASAFAQATREFHAGQIK